MQFIAANRRREIPADMAISHWAAADGWKLRRFTILPGEAPCGSLLFLGGRGDFFEKYLEAIEHWQGAGWRVDGFDWRGQGGSGRMLADPLICHLEGFDPLLADLAAFVAQWRAEAPGPHVVAGHSMGGHLALRLLAADPEAFDGAVLMAPMTGIAARPLPPLALAGLSRLACALGLARKPLWRGDIGNVGGRMTSCPDRVADKIWWKQSVPAIASGPPSWGWLRAAFASIAALKTADLSRVCLPILALASRRDPVIHVPSLKRAIKRLPDARLELLDGTSHELLREADAMRVPVLERIDDFLQQAQAAWRSPVSAS